MKGQQEKLKSWSLTALSAALVIYGIWADTYSHVGSQEVRAARRDALPDLYQEHIGNFTTSSMLVVKGVLLLVLYDRLTKRLNLEEESEQYKKLFFPLYLAMLAGVNIVGEGYYYLFKDATFTELMGDTAVGLLAISLTAFVFRNLVTNSRSED